MRIWIGTYANGYRRDAFPGAPPHGPYLIQTLARIGSYGDSQ
jgi:hypothetical protein